MSKKLIYSRADNICGLSYSRVITIFGIKLKHHISGFEYITSKYYKKSQTNLYIKTESTVKNFKKIVLYYDHSLGGGTETYFYNQLKSLKKDCIILRIQYFLQNKSYKLSINGCCKKMEIWDNDLDNMTLWLRKYGINEIILNNIVGYPSVTKVFNSIKAIKEDNSSANVVIMAHDFYPVCPKINLLNSQNQICDGVYRKEYCMNCYMTMNKEAIPDEVLCESDIENYGGLWKSFALKYSDEIRCFSPSSKKIYENIFSECASKITLVPHEFVPFKNALNVAFIGIFVPEKGSDIIINLLEYFEINNLWNIEIYIYGKGAEPLKGNPRVHIRGAYERNMLPLLLKKDNIDLIFIPSILNETFSYTTQEAIAMGYPVLCFNLGGQADPVRNYSKGQIINSFDVADIYKAIKSHSKTSVLSQ